MAQVRSQVDRKTAGVVGFGPQSVNFLVAQTNSRKWDQVATKNCERYCKDIFLKDYQITCFVSSDLYRIY